MLTDEDVRDILRLIDESEVDELLVETSGFRLHVLREGAAPSAGSRVSGVGSRVVAPAAPSPPPAASSEGLVSVDAPMMGTFYRAESPGAAPFVELGARVEKDTVVCLIEVMKMMNSVSAGVPGTVVEICAQNADLVETGDPLFRVEPDA
jgi:acetyl-CoA carboxylase biotin carboxyl carrier protein